MKNLKEYTNYLKEMNISPADAIELLKGCADLDKDEKNLIYLYCYPRNLGDRELPSRMMNFRQSTGRRYEGSLTPDYGEIALLVEAFKTEQYQNFIKHLIIAFGNPEKVMPVSGNSQEAVCPICGKKLLEKDDWEKRAKEVDPNQEYLAFGSKESSQELCKDCLVQLFMTSEVLGQLEPDYLAKWNRKIAYMNREKLTWDQLVGK